MKLLLDTNIVLDVLMDRMPFADSAAELFSRVEDGTIIGYLCSTTITTVYYLVSKALGGPRAQEEIKKLLSLFEVAPVNRLVLEAALVADFNDFEDAVIHEAARHVGAEAIVTRNQKDFKNSRISVYSSDEMAKILASQSY
ncbi:PIN domain-containing protein [Pelotalea chapellei]|uniref:PIN domain-containing protein n=1 Tax=Pelotalea chapellei TaxID=44671 RepID=A0ABS5U699_9BACT|nr:PIN domain-containing protein [Pelotalea chapellei]MBT1071184.1 PIN domain-containing protein [Pelotalea chapellei]